MIRAILFDLDGTLRFNRPSGLEAFFAVFCRVGPDVVRRGAQRNVERWTHAYWSGKHSGVVQASADPEAFWLDYTRGMLTAAGVEDSRTGLHAGDSAKRLTNVTTPSPTFTRRSPHGLARAARTSGYTLGLVSNREEDLTPVAADIGAGRLFPFYALRRAGQLVEAGRAHLFARVRDGAGCTRRVPLRRRQLLRRRAGRAGSRARPGPARSRAMCFPKPSVSGSAVST